MIQYVWEAALRARTWSGLIVATDSAEIRAVVESFGGVAELTGEFSSGTDRVASIAKRYPADIIVNLQGDEPLLSSGAIDRLVESLEGDSSFGMATLAVWKSSPEEFRNPNVVKVVCSSEGEALYFSRQPLASDPDGRFLKHIGIYAFRKASMLKFCGLAPSRLEKTERLEQLRALENGIRIKVVIVADDTIAVDTPEDIGKVERFLGGSVERSG